MTSTACDSNTSLNVRGIAVVYVLHVWEIGEANDINILFNILTGLLIGTVELKSIPDLVHNDRNGAFASIGHLIKIIRSFL